MRLIVRSTIVAGVLAVAIGLPGAALAAAASTSTASPTVSATITISSKTATKTVTVKKKAPLKPTYDLDWTLPTAGKSGCNVCHSDENLVRIQEGRTVSLYVDTALLQGSAHKNVPCTSCHVDFAYKTPHDTVVKNGEEWRAVAKLSCKNCHKDAFTLYASGSHSPAGRPGDTTGTVGAADSSAPGKPRPLCGDCHGGHGIPSKEDTAGKEAVHASALTMCGSCHVKYTDEYMDYYHGRAYQEGASDAPACWQCHETHRVLPAEDRKSAVNRNNLPENCGSCHAGEIDDVFLDFGVLVHHAQEVYDENPLYSAVSSVRVAFQSMIDSVRSLFAG